MEIEGEKDNEIDYTKDGVIDAFLLELVQEANSSTGDYLGVTLLVSGTMVSGILVGASTYYRAIAKVFSKDDSPKEGTWAKYLLDSAEDADERAGSGDAPLAQMIHLRDAKLYLNERGSIPSSGGIWWRGKLRSVDAFWIGRLRITEE